MSSDAAARTAGPSHTPRSRRVALASGLTYHVLEWGPAASADPEHTVVLVHGFLDLAWGWERVADALASRFHVIAPDLRGHGDSDWIGRGGYYHFFDYVADLDEVIARLGRRRVSVVGHSMGGNVSSYWAGTRPERIHRLALLEGLGPPEQNDPVPLRTARWIDQWREARSAESWKVLRDLDEAAARLCKHDPLLDPALARQVAARGTLEVTGGLRWKHDPLHLTAGPYPYRVDVAETFWRRITCPTLVVDGARSLLRLPDAELARRRGAITGPVRQAVIADAGHMMQRHQPTALATLLAEFLAS